MTDRTLRALVRRMQSSDDPTLPGRVLSAAYRADDGVAVGQAWSALSSAGCMTATRWGSTDGALQVAPSGCCGRAGDATRWAPTWSAITAQIAARWVDWQTDDPRRTPPRPGSFAQLEIQFPFHATSGQPTWILYDALVHAPRVNGGGPAGCGYAPGLLQRSALARCNLVAAQGKRITVQVLEVVCVADYGSSPPGGYTDPRDRDFTQWGGGTVYRDADDWRLYTSSMGGGDIVDHVLVHGDVAVGFMTQGLHHEDAAYWGHRPLTAEELRVLDESSQPGLWGWAQSKT